MKELSWISIFLFVACLQRDESELNHARGHIVAEVDMFSWLEMDDASFSRFFGMDVKLLENSSENKIQSSFDALVEQIYLRLDNEKSTIPKPRLGVYDSSFEEVSVSALFLCLAYGKEPRVDAKGVFKSADFIETGFEKGGCDHTKIYKNIADFKAVTQSIFKTRIDQDGCSVKIAEPESQRLDGSDHQNLHALDCDKIKIEFDFVGVKAVSNWVTISSAMLNKMQTMEHPEVILAHELAHYFLAHVDQGTWIPYIHSATKRVDGVPQYSKNHQQKLIDLYRAPPKFLEKIEGALFEPELFSVLFDISHICDEPKNTTPEAKMFRPVYPRTDPEKLAYLQHEVNLATCFEKKRASCVQKEIEVLGISLEYALTPLVPREIINDHIKAWGLNQGSLLGLLSEISLLVSDKKAKIIDLRRSAAKERLAFYTNEQVADETSLEYLSYLGEQYQSAPQTYLQFIKSPSEYEDCKKDLFAVETGEDVFVPIKNWRIPHHSFCFRAVNLAQEIRYHQFGR